MTTRIEGIDYLRAIMSVFVVTFHMGGGGRSHIFSKEAYLDHVFTLSDFVNFHLLLLAVPTFIFVSIYLYSSKQVDIASLQRQLSRILILLTFWPIARILYINGINGLLARAPRSSIEAIYLALRAGNTIYYFFASLIVCLLIAHLYIHLKRTLQLFVFLVSVVFIISLPQVTIMTGFYPLSAHWSPLNFIPISFAAVLFAQNQNYVLRNRKIVLLFSVVLSVLFSIFEWNYSVGQIFFPGQGYAIPAYTRASLLFSIIAVFLLALDSRIKRNGVIRYMATYSLALYCLHPFLANPARKVAAIFVYNHTATTYLAIIIAVLFSYSIAMILRKYYLSEKVIV